MAEGGGQHGRPRCSKDAGHSLTYVQRFPGFVCHIDGLPADDPCVNTPPADAYWGLWWSDGKTGEWTYSSLGAGSLAVPAGGYVAMVWDGSAGDGTAPGRPGAAPGTHAHARRRRRPRSRRRHPPRHRRPDARRPHRAPRPRARPRAHRRRRRARPRTRSRRDAVPDRGRPRGAPPSESPSDQQTEAGGSLEDPVDPTDTTAGDDGGLPAGWPPAGRRAARRGRRGRRRPAAAAAVNRRLIWLPRDLHPVAWWGWALGLAVAASSTTNPGCCCSSSAWRRWWSPPGGATIRGPARSVSTSCSPW